MKPSFNKIFEGKGINECIARAISLFKDKGDAQKRLVEE